MSMGSKSQLSPSEFQCSPQTTYYSKFFVLRMAVTINGQAAQISFSEKKQLTINYRCSSSNCLSLILYSAYVLSEWEIVLKKYGVSHVGNFCCADVPSFQVEFSSESSLRGFLHSQQRMETDIESAFENSALTLAEGMSFSVETELFLVAPNSERKDAQITRVTDDNCRSCLAVWKESEVFEFGVLFRTFKLETGGVAVKEELSVNVLISELSDVVDWFHFGLYLGVPTSEMLRIEQDRQFTMERLSHMLDWWVKNGEQPSWLAVVRALFGIRMSALARKIAVKYDVPMNPQMVVNTPTDSHSISISAAGSQKTLIQLPFEIQQVYKNLGDRDEELLKISESLPAAKKRTMGVTKKHLRVSKQLTNAKASKETLVAERNTAREQLEVEEGELRFLERLQQIEKENDNLQSVIAAKERKISQLKEQLAGKETKLREAREEIHRLREHLQQTTMELSEKSTQIREMKRAQADVERERSRADMMIMQLCAMNQGVHSPLQRVSSAEIHALKRTVEKKEEEVGRLSSLLEEKEMEKEKLLAHKNIKSQNQQEADQLVELMGELCELRSSLMEAEDGRMRAEVELEDLKSKKSVVNPELVRGKCQPADPPNCIAIGSGLQFGETNQIAQFQVRLIDANGKPCVERQEVNTVLKSLVDGSITKPEVSHQTGSAGSCKVSYLPRTRGKHELSVFVDGTMIAGSPFRVFIQQPPQLMGQLVRVIRGLKYPRRASLSSSGQLIVTESGKISVFDSQGALVHKIDSLEVEGSSLKLDPRGIAVDDSDTIYVCDNNAYKLFKVSLTGKVLKSVSGQGSDPGQFDYPDGIALRNNKLYVCDVYNHRIQIFTCDFNFIGSFGSYGSGEGEFSEPRDIAVDQEGNIYVAESGNHRVQVFSPSGIFLRTFGRCGSGSSELRGPLGIHVDHSIVYVTDRDNHCIFTFTTLGEFIDSIGKQGEFNKPRGITMDCDGFLYVCDWGNGCIKIL